MTKKSAVYQILLIFLLIVFIYSYANVRANENPTQDLQEDFWDNIYNVHQKQLVAEIPNSGIKLYYIKEDKDFGMYFGFILQINDRKKYFRWKNVSNTGAFNPQLSFGDLDNDGKEELVIRLCHGYGTGVFEGEVHVIRLDSFDEILVENPSIILYKKKIVLKEFPEYFKVVLNGKKIILNKKSRLSPPYSKVGIGVGDSTHYEIRNNNLYAKVPLVVSVINVGEFIIKYKFQDEILQMESVDFLEYK